MDSFEWTFFSSSLSLVLPGLSVDCDEVNEDGSIESFPAAFQKGSSRSLTSIFLLDYAGER